MTLTMLSHFALPLSYWSYAISAAKHIINKLPTPTLNHTSPWEALYKSSIDLTHLRIFGCTYFPLLRPYNTHKLQPHTKPCVFLGYPTYSKGYICLEPSSHRIFISRHALFNELEFPFSTVTTLSIGTSSSIHSTPSSWVTSHSY